MNNTKTISVYAGQALLEDHHKYINYQFSDVVKQLMEDHKEDMQKDFTALIAKVLPTEFKSVGALDFEIALIEQKIVDAKEKKKKKGLKPDLSKKITPKDIDKAKDEASPTIDESYYTFKL